MCNTCGVRTSGWVAPETTTEASHRRDLHENLRTDDQIEASDIDQLSMHVRGRETCVKNVSASQHMRLRGQDAVAGH